MSTALATVQPQALSLNTLDVIGRIAPAMYKSRMFGVATEDQAVAVMIKGYELGFSLSASFEFIKPIQTSKGVTPTLVPKGMMALIMNSPVYGGHTIEEKRDAKGNPDSCTVTMWRKDGFKFAVTFTMADARRADLVKAGGAWETYPANMLRWRALGFAADQVFPDVLGGMKRSDEFGAAVTEDGEIIEGSWSPAAVDTPKPPVTKVTRPVQPADMLNDLVQQFGAQRVMEAAGGKIPATMEEIEAARVVLSTAQAETLDAMTLDNVEELNPNG